MNEYKMRYANSFVSGKKNCHRGNSDFYIIASLVMSIAIFSCFVAVYKETVSKERARETYYEIAQMIQRRDSAKDEKARAEVSLLIKEILCHRKTKGTSVLRLQYALDNNNYAAVKAEIADVILFKKIYGENASYDERLLQRAIKGNAFTSKTAESETN